MFKCTFQSLVYHHQNKHNFLFFLENWTCLVLEWAWSQWASCWMFARLWRFSTSRPAELCPGAWRECITTEKTWRVSPRILLMESLMLKMLDLMMMIKMLKVSRVRGQSIINTRPNQMLEWLLIFNLLCLINLLGNISRMFCSIVITAAILFCICNNGIYND